MNLDSIPLVTLRNEKTSLGAFAGQVRLIVNVASKCGFTPQYTGLEALYQKYKSQGFVVLGFPCNQFMGQEPGDATQIETFCSTTYPVTFPIFEKIKVNGSDAHPLYTELKKQSPGLLGTTRIKWNFTKFLVNRQGHAITRYSAITKPEKLAKKIEELLGEKG
jgi:glutathione peroxidase